jgi:hypothetical protein
MKPLFNIYFVIFQQDINCYSQCQPYWLSLRITVINLKKKTIYYSFSEKGLCWTQHDTITASQLVLPPALVLL